MKKAIIVGATSGIGKELARLLVNNNYTVGITGRRIKLLQNLKKEKPNKYTLKCFDIKDTKNTSKHLNELVKELGGLDLLIISAGTGDINNNLDFDIEKRTIDTNVSGFTAIADWSFNFFKKQDYGHLVAISSIAGLRGSRQTPAYNATKAFQINYLEGLRQKSNKLKNVIITDIRPGFVKTRMAKGDGQFWVAHPKKVAEQILNAIRKKRKIAYVTKRWLLIAMLLKSLPKMIYDKM